MKYRRQSVVGGYASKTTQKVGLMARVKLNPILEQVRGKIGDLVFKRYGEEEIISQPPDFEGVEPTEFQMAQRERFRQAALYGKMVMADATSKAIYEEAAKAKGQPVFSLMVADFFNAPSVDEVDLTAYTGAVGDKILVRASDDFDVTGVNVSLTNSEGASIESGEAVETPSGSGRWVYTATAAVPTGTTVRIAVTANDRPRAARARQLRRRLYSADCGAGWPCRLEELSCSAYEYESKIKNQRLKIKILKCKMINQN